MRVQHWVVPVPLARRQRERVELVIRNDLVAVRVRLWCVRGVSVTCAPECVASRRGVGEEYTYSQEGCFWWHFEPASRGRDGNARERVRGTHRPEDAPLNLLRVQAARRLQGGEAQRQTAARASPAVVQKSTARSRPSVPCRANPDWRVRWCGGGGTRRTQSMSFSSSPRLISMKLSCPSPVASSCLKISPIRSALGRGAS